MRNFWLTADIDGRQTMLEGGPRTKDGGLWLEVRQRDDGKSVRAFAIKCYATYEGELDTFVYDHNGAAIAHFSTKR